MLEEIDKANSEKKILWEFRSVIEPSCCDVRGNVNDLRKASAICLTLSSKINSHLALIKKFWQNFLIDSTDPAMFSLALIPAFLFTFQVPSPRGRDFFYLPKQKFLALREAPHFLCWNGKCVFKQSNDSCRSLTSPVIFWQMSQAYLESSMREGFFKQSTMTQRCC